MSLQRAPSDYLAWSILGCLFCLWPVGLCAIFASLDSRSKADSGDYEGAKTSGRRALGINTANTILGAILITVLTILMM
ncbi:trafficking regulator of GLUT4 1-like [Ylistrum balloti]|uniref:trafficking regulator of GLUT4 1-like n=1 Tax=Ylistrum balloti TaxID=509963 RepID=UPI0029058C70|nr:trafficking regulator of GLUT4 1-like [Ylistrum balloti]